MPKTNTAEPPAKTTAPASAPAKPAAPPAAKSVPAPAASPTPAPAASPARDARGRRAASVSADALLAEARRAITGTDIEAARLWLLLARAGARAFPADAARDATRAFELAIAQPARESGIQSDALAVIVGAGRVADARKLAARGTADCATLMSPIIAGVTADDAFALARGCRDRDRTYPYGAVAARAFAEPAGSPARARLVDQAIESLVFETTATGRAAGFAFVESAAACSLLTGDQVLRVQGHMRQTASIIAAAERASCGLGAAARSATSDVAHVAATATASLTPDDLDVAVQTARGEATMRDKVRALIAIAETLMRSDR